MAEASHLPLSDSRQIGFRLEHAAHDDYHEAENSLVTPGYFHAMGIALVAGRDFTFDDRRDSPPVAIISQSLGREYFPGQNPIGQRFQWGDRAMFTIIGVAADVHVSSLDTDAPPMIYNDMFQIESGASVRTAFILRGKTAGPELLPAIRQQVWSVDSELPLYEAATLQSLISESLAQRSFTLVLLGAFAVTALLLAAVGIFGVISYLVAQRSAEFGVRMALGANRSQIANLVLSRGAMIAATGCVCGLVLSAFASRLLLTSLYRTHWYDPVMLSLVPLLLFVVVLLASWLPARRAAATEPMTRSAQRIECTSKNCPRFVFLLLKNRRADPAKLRGNRVYESIIGNSGFAPEIIAEREILLAHFRALRHRPKSSELGPYRPKYERSTLIRKWSKSDQNVTKLHP